MGVLPVIEFTQQQLRRVGAGQRIALSLAGEHQIAPHLRHMYVDHSGGRPDPVMLRQRLARGFIHALYIAAIANVHIPLHPGEVHSPDFARLRGEARGVTLVLSAFAQGKPRDPDFQRPSRVLRRGIVQPSVDFYSGFKPMYIPADDAPHAVALRLFHQQIPDGVGRVHLQFVVTVRGILRSQKNLEIVVDIDQLVAVPHRSPNRVVGQLRPYIQRLVVPQQLYPGLLGGTRPRVALDVVKIVHPWRVLPERLVKIAVQVPDASDGSAAVADGGLRRDDRLPNAKVSLHRCASSSPSLSTTGSTKITSSFPVESDTA